MMKISPGVKQSIYVSGVLCNMISVGSTLAYPATLIPALMEPTSDIKIDLKMASWIASMPGISGIIPTVLLGPIMHFYGRKVANICLSVPIVIGWVLTYFAAHHSSISLLLVGRFLQGLALGGPYFISVCIGEFSDPKNRSFLLGCKIVAGVMSVAFIHAMAFFLHWKNLALVGAIPPVVALLVTSFWPNTPDWLISRGRYKEAGSVFYSLRGYSEEGKRELKHMIETEKTRRHNDHQNKLNLRSEFWKKMKSPVLWKPVGVMFVTILVSMAGGRQFLASYSVHLAAEISGDQTKGYFYTIIADVISVVAAFISIYLNKVYSRRFLLFSTGFLGFALLAASSAMLYIRTSQSSKLVTWFTLSLFALYFFFANVGFFPITFMLMGELFPLEYRAFGSVIDGILCLIGTAVVVGILPWLEQGLGTHGMLLTFDSVMLIGLIYLYYELPETKNRTLNDVGDYFRGKSPKIRCDPIRDLNDQGNELIATKNQVRNLP